MKLSHLLYGAAGYVLGTRAGPERYDQIVRLARRVTGSQTVQATAGVVQAQLDRVTAQARNTIAARIAGGQSRASTTRHNGTNGYQRA